MFIPGLPVLLLLIWLPTSILGCLQCDQKFKENVAQLRTVVVPRQIHDTRLKERAEVLLKVKSKVDALIEEARSRTATLLRTPAEDLALLDKLVTFRRKTTMKLKQALKEHQVKACDKEGCGWLKYKVINCKSCQETLPSCLTLSQCFVDSQERLSLRYGKPLKDPNIARTGVAIVLCMGGVLFLVTISVIVVYWRNRLFEFV
nr:izumo sperm-egg fusion protein 2 isoform X2 [Pogona vitticeps]